MSGLQIYLTVILALITLVLIAYVYSYYLLIKAHQQEVRLIDQLNHLQQTDLKKRINLINSLLIHQDINEQQESQLNQMIKLYDLGLVAVINNVSQLNHLRLNDHYWVYLKKIRTLNRDVTLLVDFSEQLDLVLTRLLSFREQATNLVLEYQKVYLTLENFYEAKLLPNNFNNANLKQLWKNIRNDFLTIRSHLTITHLNLLTTSFQNLNEQSQQLQVALKFYFLNLEKIHKINDFYQELKKLRTKPGLLLTNNQNHNLTNDFSYIESNLKPAFNQIQQGSLTNSDLVNLMLEKMFYLQGLLELSYQEAVLLDKQFINSGLSHHCDQLMHQLQTQLLPILQQWVSDLTNKANDLLVNITNLVSGINNLGDYYQAFSQLLQKKEQIGSRLVLQKLGQFLQAFTNWLELLQTVHQAVLNYHQQYLQAQHDYCQLNHQIHQLLHISADLFNQDHPVYQQIQLLVNKSQAMIDQYLVHADQYEQFQHQHLQLKLAFDHFVGLINQVGELKALSLSAFYFYNHYTIKKQLFDRTQSTQLKQLVAQKNWVQLSEVLIQQYQSWTK